MTLDLRNDAAAGDSSGRCYDTIRSAAPGLGYWGVTLNSIASRVRPAICHDLVVTNASRPRGLAASRLGGTGKSQARFQPCRRNQPAEAPRGEWSCRAYDAIRREAAPEPKT